MLQFLNLQPEIYGVDINDLSIRITKLEKKRNSLILSSFNEVQIPSGIVTEGVIRNGDALATIIKSAVDTVKGQKLETKYAVISLPEEKSFFQVIKMPKMTEEELRSAVVFEAESYIPLPMDMVYLDFEVIKYHKNDADHLDLLVSAMPKTIVDSYVSCYKKAGLVPYVLEVESQAIMRSLLKKDEVMPPTIFIDFGETKTSFIIFSGSSIRFTSSISVSSKQLTQTIADTMNIEFDKAEKMKIEYGLGQEGQTKYNIVAMMEPVLNNLVNEIKKYVNFYYGHVSHDYFMSDRKIVKIVLCGGGSNLKNLPTFLSEQLKMPVEIGNPLKNIMVNKSSSAGRIPVAKMMSFATAIGLAIRGANENF